MLDTAIAVEGTSVALEEEEEEEEDVDEMVPTDTATSVTHEAPWFPHDFTWRTCEPDGEGTDAFTWVL